MSEFGTGASSDIWKWWTDFHEKYIRRPSAAGEALDIGMMIQAPFRFIVAVIGTFFVGIVDVFIELGKAIGNLFNATDDDNARTWSQDASRVRGATNNQISDRLNALLSGPTGDDDEAAILRILGALDCGRRTEVVALVGVDRLLSDVDGSEWDDLLVLLADCGIVGFNTMDDDASRAFVNRYDCSKLGNLPIGTVAQLVRNMFSGSCGDDDEDAILKLLRCQSGERIKQLVTHSGTHVSDFDHNFDGDQWDQLEDFFANFGIELDP